MVIDCVIRFGILGGWQENIINDGCSRDTRVNEYSYTER